MTHQEDSASTAQAATGNGCAGLIAHLSWALRLDEAQAAKVAEIAAQWSDPSEGQYAFDRCESPAERLFLLGGLLWKEGREEDVQLRDGDDPEHFVFMRDGRDVGGSQWSSESHVGLIEELALHSQVQIDKYRVDFVIDLGRSNRDGDPDPWTRIAVEIDGHDYHSSKEQLASDHVRDMALLLRGIPTIRLTGSMVYADPGACFGLAVRMARKLESMASAIDNSMIDSYQAGVVFGESHPIRTDNRLLAAADRNQDGVVVQ